MQLDVASPVQITVASGAGKVGRVDGDHQFQPIQLGRLKFAGESLDERARLEVEVRGGVSGLSEVDLTLVWVRHRRALVDDDRVPTTHAKAPLRVRGQRWSL